jgi:hypothetical protein
MHHACCTPAIVPLGAILVAFEKRDVRSAEKADISYQLDVGVRVANC